MTEAQLSHILVESGVSERTGEGFCPITATAVDGRSFVGQLSPGEVRVMALNFLAAAEAAEHDAIAYTLMEEITEDETLAGRFVAMMRSRRPPS